MELVHLRGTYQTRRSTLVRRLEYYMTFLREEERQVINECFFEDHSLQRAAETLGMSVWAVRKLRDSAVESLARKYSFVAGEK